MEGRLTILVVDDEPAIRLLLSRFLKSFGMDVIEAGSAREGLETFPAADIDILISDIVMPGGSGLDLAAKLREQRPALPILFISGSLPEGEPGNRIILNERTAFLPKPFPLETLVVRLKSLFETATRGPLSAAAKMA